MPVHRTELAMMGFAPTQARIALVHDRLHYAYDLADDVGPLAVPGVYLFVRPHRLGRFSVVVVGSAAHGLHQRMAQLAAQDEQRRRIQPPGGVQPLQAWLAHNRGRPLQVWFRPDGGGQAGGADEQILDEQAITAHFLERQEPLLLPVQAQQPAHPPQAAAALGPLHPALQALTQELHATTSETLMQAWTDAVAGWDEPTRQAFVVALARLDGTPLREGRSAKIIGEYTKGPFPNERLLVFGELGPGGTRFRKHTNEAMFTLDGRYLVLYPNDPEHITIIALADIAHD